MSRGWFVPPQARKAHYYDLDSGDTLALCGKWWSPGLRQIPEVLDDTGHDSSGNCPECKKRRVEVSS